jgi:hypothetical protein
MVNLDAAKMFRFRGDEKHAALAILNRAMSKIVQHETMKDHDTKRVPEKFDHRPLEQALMNLVSTEVSGFFGRQRGTTAKACRFKSYCSSASKNRRSPGLLCGLSSTIFVAKF